MTNEGEERFALVTGSSGGIGLEIARELAARPLCLVLAARSEGRLAAAAAESSRVLLGIRVASVAEDLLS